MMKKLPIGISTLENIRADDYIYIDKTHHVANLVKGGGKYIFLSRPRRFGKSLLLDSLKQAFLGNKEVFKGLYLEKNWAWDTSYPVIHFSFGSGSAFNSQAALEESIYNQIENHANTYGVKLISKLMNSRFNELIIKVADITGKKIVLLVDEYDKPILDVINNNDEALINREILKGLYSVIKDNDQNLKFVMLTGVSKFSKVSLFSGLNNLDDISLDPQYSDICGYTQSEMEQSFDEYLQDGKVDKVKLKQWYNGYNFTGLEEQKVYNPFDILLFCSKDYRYKNYWFETATPSFLIKLIENKNYYIPKLEQYRVTDESLSSFDVDNIPLQTLLFQTGYLTIKEIITIGTQYAYVLSYPNLEVKSSLNSHLMQLGNTTETKNETLFAIGDALADDNFSELKNIFNAHFAAIPHDWYRNNPIAKYEGFYAGIVYSCFAALGYNLQAEDTTSTGRIDLTIQMPEKIIIIEFKLSKYGSAKDALQQIKDKGYVNKFKDRKLPIYLIGMSFDENSRNMDELVWQLRAIAK